MSQLVKYLAPARKLREKKIAKENDSTMIVLDAFTGNFKAHRFYYNQGFSPKGFHFVKILNETKKKNSTGSIK